MTEMTFDLLITDAQVIPIAPWLTPGDPQYDPDAFAEDIAEMEAVQDFAGRVLPASYIFESAFFASPPASGQAAVQQIGTPLTLGTPPEDGVSSGEPGSIGLVGMFNDLDPEGGAASNDVVAFAIERPYVGPGPDDADDFFHLFFVGGSDWFDTETDILESLRASLSGESGVVQQATFSGRSVARSDAEFGEVTLWDEVYVGEVVAGSLAFSTLGGSEAAPLLPDTPTVDGESVFVLSLDDIVATVDEDGRLWIDPEIAVGYDYAIEGGLFAGVTAPSFDVVADSDGYELVIGGSSFALGVGQSLDFADLGFGGGVSAFSILGIDEALMLDPDDPLAFTIGVSLVDGSVTEGISITQTALTVEVDEPSAAVPLPASALLLAAGIGGLAWRGRRAA